MSIKYSREVIEIAKDLHETEEWLAVCLDAIEHRGDTLLGMCPFCEMPSLGWHRSKKLFYCYSCGQGGDVIGLFMRYYGCTFVEALEKIGCEERSREVKTPRFHGGKTGVAASIPVYSSEGYIFPSVRSMASYYGVAWTTMKRAVEGSKTRIKHPWRFGYKKDLDSQTAAGYKEIKVGDKKNRNKDTGRYEK